MLRIQVRSTKGDAGEDVSTKMTQDQYKYMAEGMAEERGQKDTEESEI